MNRAGRELRMLSGVGLAAAGYLLFLIPGDIAPGGFTGAAQILNRVTGLSIGLLLLALNAPVFLLAWRRNGRSYVLRSAAAAALYTAALEWIPAMRLTGDLLLSSVFGGLLAGAGFGLVLRGEASTGGVDMLADLMSRAHPGLRVGSAMFAIDGILILCSGLVYGAERAMYALVAAFVVNIALSLVLDGPESARMFFIISADPEETARRILRELGRGATLLSARGAYTGAEKQMVLCVAGRGEAAQVRRIAFSVDENAFFVACRAGEALGNGFRRSLSR